jgi:membrane protease YdiL (CAAX protease family)
LGESRLRCGLAVLPIQLNSSLQQSDQTLRQDDQRTSAKFVWFAITLMNQVGLIGGAIAALTLGAMLNVVYFRYLHSHPVSLLNILTLVTVPAFFFLVILYFFGPSRRDVLRDTLRLPFPEYFVIAFLMPVTIYAVSQICAGIRDPLHWIAYPVADHDSPLPPALMLFELFLLALVEEIAWRGYLQPRFISRFGLYRGVFFVGLVWAAFHFSGDFRSSQSDVNVVRSLVGRILGASLIGFALSWLTLRSKSVLPAAVAHTTINGINRFGETSYWFTLSLWAVVDLLLYRFWLPREAVLGPSESSATETKSSG